MIRAKKILYQIKRIWDYHPFFALLAVFCIVFFSYSTIYLFNPGISFMDDHLFHFRYADLLKIQGWDVVKNFDWILFSKTAQEHSRYPLSLFQVALIPFTYINNSITGLKISDIFWASSALTILYYVFRKVKIKFPFLFILVTLASAYFASRVLIGRALVLIVALVFLEIYLATEKKYKKLFFVFLFHILWHQTTFFLPVIIVGMTETARYLAQKNFYVKNILSYIAAFIFGAAFFPNFPRNLWIWTSQIINVQLSAINDLKGEGNELYTRDALNTFWGSADIFFLMAVVAIGLVICYYVMSKKNSDNIGKEKEGSLTILMYSAFFLLLLSIFGSMVISGRFYDFYIPSVVFLTAIILTKFASENRIKIDPTVFKFVIPSIFIFFAVAAGNNFLNIRNQISKNDYRPYNEIAVWINAKSNGKELVFLQNWSHFTALFFFNQKNIYTMGIEPSLMLQNRPELYWKWYNIFQYNYYCERQSDCEEENNIFIKKIKEASNEQRTQIIKETGEKIIHSVRNDFGSKFIVSDSLRLDEEISANPDLVEDSFEAKSEINGTVLKAFQLK